LADRNEFATVELCGDGLRLLLQLQIARFQLGAILLEEGDVFLRGA
jgi:hypothetical protein